MKTDEFLIIGLQVLHILEGNFHIGTFDIRLCPEECNRRLRLDLFDLRSPLFDVRVRRLNVRGGADNEQVGTLV